MTIATTLVAMPIASAWADADIPPPTDRVVKYSPYPEKNFPNRVFFGDTHLHTSYSTDAGMVGNRLGPDEAGRAAEHPGAGLYEPDLVQPGTVRDACVDRS
jgi:hypothetical protein